MTLIARSVRLVTQLRKRTRGGKSFLVPVQSALHLGHKSSAGGSEGGGVLGSVRGDGWEGVYRQDNLNFAE